MIRIAYRASPDSPEVRLQIPERHDWALVGDAICRHLWPGWKDGPDLKFEAIMKREAEARRK